MERRSWKWSRVFLNRYTVAIVVLLLVGECLNMAYRGLTEVERGENLPSVSWLPASASNVSFYCSYGFTAYEFDIPEQEFLAWAKGEGYPFRKTGGSLRRYNDADGTRFAEPATNVTDEEFKKESAKQQEYEATRSKVIEAGYYYSDIRPNGGVTRVGYDRQIGRAYYESTPR